MKKLTKKGGNSMTKAINPELIDDFEDSQKGKFLIFSVGNEMYGIEIQYVTEIVGIQPVTEVPEFPENIIGVINLRGKIIPVMDVRLRFKKPLRKYDSRTCIIVIDSKATSVGLIVDSVSEVLEIQEEDIVSPPDMKSCGSSYLKAIGRIGNDIKLLLDCERFLGDEEKELLNVN